MKYLLLLFLTMGCFREPTIEEMMGPDKDGNGVRDDIDEYINDVTKDPDERNAFKQYAKYLRLGFKYYQDKEKSITNTHTSLKALDCVSKIWERRHKDYRERIKYSEIIDEIDSKTYETLKTLSIKAKISGDFSGQVSGVNDNLYEVCEFKLRKKY